MDFHPVVILTAVLWAFAEVVALVDRMIRAPLPEEPTDKLLTLRETVRKVATLRGLRAFDAQEFGQWLETFGQEGFYNSDLDKWFSAWSADRAKTPVIQQRGINERVRTHPNTGAKIKEVGSVDTEVTIETIQKNNHT